MNFEIPEKAVSIILPVWREGAGLPGFIREAAAWPEVREVIVSIADGAPDFIKALGDAGACCVDAARPSRGAQMNLGAHGARGEWLLFHHADSVLTRAHVRSLASLTIRRQIVGGAFYRKFDERHPHCRWLEPIERWHNRTCGPLYGDQSIFVRRLHFEILGGFAEIPLMEDLEFSKRLRRSGELALLDPPIASSPRKHLSQGSWRTTILNAWLIFLYKIGISPARLHARYYAPSRKAGGSLKDRGDAFLTNRPPQNSMNNSQAQSKWKARWNAFLHPIDPEKQSVLKERWESLPEELRTDNQISGRHLTHCGFTLGASYCSFHCTHCYLPKNANDVPIPSLADMKEQIDANRRFQGPGGGLQITGGDVADAYWRASRQSELVEIVRYARSTGLVPMLMTHGQTFIEHPEFLEQLMIEGGLRQVSVHIDVTQAGRHGFPINRVRNEADLDEVRAAFTDLGWRLREKTGLPLEFAQSFTVTRKNINDVPDVIRWFLADPRRTQLWRMLAFQPEADTGRTLFSENPITPAMVWDKICAGANLPLRRDASIFGHPDCNSWGSLLVSQDTGEYCPLLPDDPQWDHVFGEVLARIGGLSLVSDDAGTTAFRLLGVLAQNAGLTCRLAWHLARHVASGKIPATMLLAALRGRVHTVGAGMHNFMDASTVAQADSDPVVHARLHACVFKGAVKQNGEWKAVPMCRMNQQTWSDVYDERLGNADLRSQKQPWRPEGGKSAPKKEALKAPGL
jgi:rSAM/selenodomain-associated transferase 2